MNSDDIEHQEDVQMNLEQVCGYANTADSGSCLVEGATVWWRR